MTRRVHSFGKEKDEDLVSRAVDSVEEEIGTSLGLFPEIEDYLRRNRQNTYDEAVDVDNHAIFRSSSHSIFESHIHKKQPFLLFC